jgi:hypothetical protein
MPTFEDIVSSGTPEHCIAELQTNENRVASFIPIFQLENMLDVFQWSTSNFQYQIFKDGYANLCIAASLELEIVFGDIRRKFVGACNFGLKDLFPNTHFLATAKSECIKNAASDIGKYFGRGLNNDVVPTQIDPKDKPIKRSKPDIKIMKQFEEAVKNNDQAAIILLTNIYDIKTN